MVETDEYLVMLVSETCPSCGVTFAMPDTFVQAKRDNHTDFFCPNGHSLSYDGKSDAEKLRDRLNRAEAQLVHERDQRAAVERSLAAQKGVATRIKNRIAAGVCPCCRRSFQDLHRHMSGQHPDFAGGQENV